jgi:hypothetical protein
MTDCFLERDFDPPIDTAAVLNMALDCFGCFSVHRVDWCQSLLAKDGGRMLCWFRAPDLESSRIAMRQSNVDCRNLWRGSVHDGPGLDEKGRATANVLVERQFDEAVTLGQIQAIEDAGIHCLESRNVHFVRTFFAADRQRMICLYRAPDAESVREAQRQAGVPFTTAWAFRTIGRIDLKSATS